MDKQNRNVYSREEAIKASTEYFKGDVMAAEVWVNKYALKDVKGNIYELTPNEMHLRLASEIERIEKKYVNPTSKEELLDVLNDFKYIVPQGSPMAGIGNDFQFTSISNCFVIGNEKDSDSYGGIFKLDQETAQLQKRRAGVGVDLSFIRPKGSTVLNSALTSTGVPTFMDRYSNTTKEVAQDGRRGALMESISIAHPDAESFIDAKMTDGKVTGANISVKLTDDFMAAALDDKTFVQQYPVDSLNPTVTKNVEAKPIWDKIIHNAWKSAEPGILFWDTVIKESIADCYADLGFKTVSTNPCGEIPLCAGDSCRLLAINLYSYVKNPFTKDAKFDFVLFKKHVRLAMRIMDDIVDLEDEKIEGILSKIDSDPEDDNIKQVERNLWNEILKKARMGRRTGLGVTAEGDMLAALGLIYGTDKAIGFSEEVHKTLKLEAYRSSVEMAEERGTFEMWNAERELENPFLARIKDEDPDLYNRMQKSGRRNLALLTLAPTGSVSICTQSTSGFEPIFKPMYMRRRKINPQEVDVKVDFTDKEGNAWQEYAVFHNKFEKWLEINDYDVTEVKSMKEDEILKIVELSPYFNATAHDIDWVQKVKMQGRIQKHIDHSISVTINLPEDVSEQVVSDVYAAGWKTGCKGLTVYREGSREGVLVSNNKKEEVKEAIQAAASDVSAVKRPKIVDADVVLFQNSKERWVAVVGKVAHSKEGKLRPYEFFTGKLESFPIPPSIKEGVIIKRKIDGESIYDFRYKDKDGYDVTMEGLSRSFNKEYWNYAKLISGLLRHRMPLESLINVIRGLNLDDDNLNTWKNGIIRVIKRYIEDGTESASSCPHCGAKLVYIEGCLKCDACGKFSLCG